MSEIEIYKEFRGLQPTYSNVLNLCLATVVNALNDGNIIRAFKAVKTLIIVSPPKGRKESLEDLKKVEAALVRAKKIQKVDLYQTRRARNRATLNILRAHTLPLFNRVIERLHAAGYLEKSREIQRGHEMK